MTLVKPTNLPQVLERDKSTLYIYFVRLSYKYFEKTLVVTDIFPLPLYTGLYFLYSYFVHILSYWGYIFFVFSQDHQNDKKTYATNHHSKGRMFE